MKISKIISKGNQGILRSEMPESNRLGFHWNVDITHIKRNFGFCSKFGRN